MARTKAVVGSGASLADCLSASLVARVVPAEVVHQVLDEYGRNSQRLRSFPAVAGGYYCMALSLYPEETRHQARSGGMRTFSPARAWRLSVGPASSQTSGLTKNHHGARVARNWPQAP